MRSALIVITGFFAVSLATTPAVSARDREDKANAAAPAPSRQVAVPRSESRQMPSPAISGGERGAGRSMAREAAAPPRMVFPRSESGQVPAPATARVSVPAFASGGAAVSEAREDRARGRSAPRDNGGGRAQAAPRGERRAPDSGRAQAAPRGERSAPSSGREQPASASPRGERRATRDDGGSGSTPAAAPRADRPRDGRHAVGQATTRTRPVYGGGGYYSRPAWYYRPSALYGYGAFGLGYFYYDPFWGGYSGYGYSPYGGYYGGGYYGSGYGGYGGYGSGYGGPYGGGYYGGGGGGGGYYGTGHLRLKVKPRDAEVYVDGYYAGLVDDFDGVFQKLELDAGPHRIEVRKPGFATMTFDVRIPTSESVTYRGEMNPLP